MIRFKGLTSQRYWQCRFCVRNFVKRKDIFLVKANIRNCLFYQEYSIIENRGIPLVLFLTADEAFCVNIEVISVYELYVYHKTCSRIIIIR